MSALTTLYERERERLCAMHDTPTGDRMHPVFGEGNESPRLLFIGEAPGRDEALAGRPFIGKAGKQLDEMLHTAAICRTDVYVTNTVKYRPTNVKTRSVSNRTPKPFEVADGLPLLLAEIEALAPKVIATLGNTPLGAVYSLSGCLKPPVIGGVHGKAQRLVISDTQFILFPLYHPASGIYRRELVPVMEKDLIELGRLLEMEEIE